MQRSFRGLSATGALALVAALVAVAWTGSADAQNDAPKPSVTIQGSALYLGKGRDNITITLSKRGEPSPAEVIGQDGKDDKKKEEEKPMTATSDAKGEFTFKNVPIGKYRMTAKGRPANSLRAYKEADPVDVDVTAESSSPITKNVTLTQDKAK